MIMNTREEYEYKQALIGYSIIGSALFILFMIVGGIGIGVYLNYTLESRKVAVLEKVTAGGNLGDVKEIAKLLVTESPVKGEGK